MNQAPHITIEHASIFLAEDVNEIHALVELFNRRIDAYNKAIEIALAEASAEQSTNVPHITIEQIAATYPNESAETHHGVLTRCNNAISAYNEKQGQKLKNEIGGMSTPALKSYLNVLTENQQQYITAEEARKLVAAELGDTVEWWLGSTNMSEWETLDFNSTCLYTYKLKANLVKLDGELMTREAAIAEWENKKETCEFLVKGAGDSDFEVMTHHHHFNEYAASGCEYQLRAKPLKQVSWKDVPVGVAVVQNGMVFTLVGRYKNQGIVAERDGAHVLYKYFSELKLAPASEQPWLVYTQGETDLSSLKGMEIEVKRWSASRGNFVVNSYKDLGLLLNNFIVAYRITGLVEGWAL